MKRLLRICLLAALLPALSGCATKAFTAMQEPEIDVINILPLASEGLLEQRARVDLRIINPNDFDLHISGISFQLDINDARFTRGVSNASFTVPRLGDAKTSIVVTTTVLDVFRQVMALDKHQNLDYAINGRVYFDNARIRSVSFRHTGDLQGN
jgi:LEA14-like dessication related protein